MKKYILIALGILPIIAMAQIADSTKREVKLQGAINFRDLGGYKTKDGKQVKWGKIYRSAALDKLTDADLQKLQGLSIEYVDDFRGPYEVKAAPDKQFTNEQWVSLPSGSEKIGDSSYAKTMMQQMASGAGLTDFYSNIAPLKARYKPMFEELMQLNKDSALLFHCTAGKDRTGIAAAFVLYALGVDEQTIMQDYLATNYYRSAENDRAINGMVKMYGISEPNAKKMMAAEEEYLKATFDAIHQQYGSMDNYFEKELGIGKKQKQLLRNLYTD